MTGEATIFALATAPGRAGVAVMRLSGPRAGAVVIRLSGSLPPPRRAKRAKLRDPVTSEVIDDGLVLWFPAPASYTGEDVAEFHIHGGRAVMAALVETLGRLEGLRLAEPGEFTRRAFENGKLDLTEAEAVGDLVMAETSAQRRQALRQLDGIFGDLCEDWRRRLLRAQALCEAAIDFPEEGLPEDLERGMLEECHAVGEEIARQLADGRQAERVRDGLSIAIVGPPNAGKSSLLNLLARREVAITSEIAGTTRDVIEVHLDLDGYPVILADTAGLRDTSDGVESEGVRRARERALKADLKLVVLDGTDPSGVKELEGILYRDAIPVLNKLDLKFGSWPIPLEGSLAISIRTGEGIPALIDRLKAEVARRLGGGSGLVTRVRHREALEGCRAALAKLSGVGLPELRGEELRVAVQELGRITGRVDVEAMLDVLFREFCIGK